MACLVGGLTKTKSLMGSIGKCELMRVIRHLPNGKAHGPNGVPGELLKYAPDCVHQKLLTSLNSILSNPKATFPSEWRKALLFPILKSEEGHCGDPSNRRPIMLLDVTFKNSSGCSGQKTAARAGGHGGGHWPRTECLLAGPIHVAVLDSGH